MKGWGTVDPIEVIWTLAALPGLVVWVVNLVSASRSLRAVRVIGIVNGRRMIARYSVRKCWVLVIISGVFVLIGVSAMLRPPNPGAPRWDWLSLLLTAGLLGAPALITLLGFDWRRVEASVLHSARRDTAGKTLYRRADQ